MKSVKMDTKCDTRTSKSTTLIDGYKNLMKRERERYIVYIYRNKETKNNNIMHFQDTNSFFYENKTKQLKYHVQ